MQTFIIDSSNVSSAVTELKKGGKYFVINVDIVLPAHEETKIPNSVLSFNGGSLVGAPEAVLNLSSTQINAGSYPIFLGSLKVKNLTCAAVRAEWFRKSSSEADADYINRAISMANGCPVVLEAKTYILKNSIKFKDTDNSRQTLICPGTLSVASATESIPAIEINSQTVTLKVNRIVGGTTSAGHKGIGIRFNTYVSHSNIEVNTMRDLNRAFSVDPEMNGRLNSDGTQKFGGVQYCRIKFGIIQADYGFYVDIFKGAVVIDSNTKKPLTAIPTNDNDFKDLKVELSNWFSESQISGSSMEGKYGIYIKSLTESTIDPRLYKKLYNAINGLQFENISFENITGLAIRLRSVERSSFLNLQMFNRMPGTDPVGTDDFTLWIDLDDIQEIRMTFNSYVVPTHIKVGDDCKRTYINGAILDEPAKYGSHFDTLGIDTLYGNDASNQVVQRSQMFVTNSVTPYNMTKSITVTSDTTKHLGDLLPNLAEGTSADSGAINLPVLPYALRVVILDGKTLTIDLSGLNYFSPCLYVVHATIDGKLLFCTSDNINIEGGSENGKMKEISISGWYTIQWLNNWEIRISKV